MGRSNFPRVHVAREHFVTAVWLMGDFESVCLSESTGSRCAVADAIRLLRAAIQQLRKAGQR